MNGEMVSQANDSLLADFTINPDGFEPTQKAVAAAYRQFCLIEDPEEPGEYFMPRDTDPVDESKIRKVKVTAKKQFARNALQSQPAWQNALVIEAEVLNPKTQQWERKSITTFPLYFHDFIKSK